MLFVALKRLWTRPLLTLLSIIGVTLSIGLVTAIPLFSQAVSFVMLTGELSEISALSGRPPFSMRVYALPGAQYPLSMERARLFQDHVAEAIVSEVGLPLVAQYRQMESQGLILYTPRAPPSPYGQEQAELRRDLYFLVSPGIDSRIDVVQGEPMTASASPASGRCRAKSWMSGCTSR